LLSFFLIVRTVVHAEQLSIGVYITALLVACVMTSHAQQLPVYRYDVSDGLAHSIVKAIHQDRKGYLWFGTYEGLSRFDGYRFTNYSEHDGLGHIIVNDIAEDRQGRLWVGTNGGGVARLTDDPHESGIRDQGGIRDKRQQTTNNKPRTRRKFISFRVGDASHSNYVNALLFDADDNLWCATDAGLYRARVGQDRELKFQSVAPHREVAVAMPALADRHGRLWFGIEDELVEVVQGQIIKYGSEDRVGRHLIVSVVEDRQGRLLVANERQVFEFIAPPTGQSRGRWRPFPLTLAPDQRVTEMAVDAAGTLWVGTMNGLIKYRDGKQTLYTDVQGLSNNAITALTEDRDGNLWVGTYGRGVCKLSGELIVSFTPTEGVPNQNVYSVIEDRQGRLYAGVMGGGLVEIVEGRAVPVPGSQAPPFRFWSFPFQDSHGDWWVRTYSDGLFRFAGPDLQLRRGRKLGAANGIPLKANESPLVTIDPSGHLWIVSREGLYQRDLARQGRAGFERIPVNISLSGVVVLMGDRQGALWLGGHDVFARWMNGKTTVLQPAEGLPEINPRAFFQDSRGWLWVGLRFRGVSVTKDPSAETPQFVNYSTQNGLTSDTVRSMTEDDAGRIYLSTGKGLDQLDPATGRIRHFNIKDGLASDFVGQCLKDRNGNIWVATSQGLSKLNPRAERVAHPPPIYLSRVQVAGEDWPLPETGAVRIPELELPATRNNLLIEYVALSFQGEQRLRYQYKLEGADADWSPPSEGRSANYPRLTPGSYQFLVRAINQGGAMSPEPAVLRFRILPPLWQRWWFLMLAALGLGLIGYAGYRYRVAQLLKLERVRTRIAADLHDDIGSNLTRIALLGEVVRQQMPPGDPEMTERLASIAHISRESVDAMSDIVWAINPKRDRLRDLTQRMRRFAEDAFQSRNIAFRFRAPSLEQDIKLGADMRRGVFLIFKESVNNMVRHSACTEAEIDFQIEGGWLVLKLSDNGKGLDLTHESEGQGLLSMRQRAKKLGGELEIRSPNGQGTTVTLRVPLR
jgi:ligand-binding sensor domain-containing protein/two-component sensor histidine kinase